jgi:hypothetical protein
VWDRSTACSHCPDPVDPQIRSYDAKARPGAVDSPPLAWASLTYLA